MQLPEHIRGQLRVAAELDDILWECAAANGHFREPVDGNRTPSGGLELRPVDRLMRLRHADSCGAAVAALSGVVLLLAVSPPTHTLRQLWQMLLERAGIFGLFGLLFAPGGWWTVRTWKALWRRVHRVARPPHAAARCTSQTNARAAIAEDPQRMRVCR